jgi:hypothetical protein
VRRNGEDFAAVIAVEHLELIREVLSRRKIEEAAAEIDWAPARASLRLPQSWFDDEDDNPFVPAEKPSS